MQHTIYETHIMQSPLLPFIFNKTLIVPNRNYCIANWHENVEIILFLSGSGVVKYETESFPVESGDIVAVNCNSLHQIESDGELEYYYMIVDRSFCRENGFDTNNINFTHLIKDGEAEALYQRIADIFYNTSSKYRTPALRAAILEFMAYMCENHSSEIAVKYKREARSFGCIKQAIGMIRSECEKDISVDELAETVGLSKFYFVREFKHVTGYTPVAYINLARCAKAKHLLTEGDMSIGQIAVECGFFNRSYFSSTFKRICGMLPGEYRKMTQNK